MSSNGGGKQEEKVVCTFVKYISRTGRGDGGGGGR